MNFILILLFFIIVLFFNTIIYKKVFTFPLIITIIWCFFLTFSTFGLFDTYTPIDEVIKYTIIFLISFNVSYFLIKALFFNKNINSNKEIDINEYEINNKILSFLLLMCMAFIIIVLRNNLISAIKTLDFSMVRNSFINYDIIGTYMQVLIGITAIPIGRACTIISCINYIYKRKINSSFVLSILFTILNVLSTGGRSLPFFFVLTILVTIINKEGGRILLILKKNKKIVRIVVILIAIIMFVTFGRGFNDNSIMKSLYVYFSGPFILFSTYIKSAELERPLLYGQVLISGFSFPIIEILRFVFNVDILAGNYILDEQITSKYLGISRNIVINATPTTMFFAMRDFGLLGLIIYPIVINYFYLLLKKKYMLKRNISTESIYVYFITNALMLHTHYYFCKFQNLSVFFYIYFIYKIFEKKKEKNDDMLEKDN